MGPACLHAFRSVRSFVRRTETHAYASAIVPPSQLASRATITSITSSAAAAAAETLMQKLQLPSAPELQQGHGEEEGTEKLASMRFSI